MLQIGLQMERPSEAAPSKSTNHALALEAARRNYGLFQFLPADIHAGHDGIRANARPLSLAADGATLQEGEPGAVSLNDADVILIRQDPPYDMGYITACHLLKTLAKPRFINHPEGLLLHTEKTSPLDFPEWIPETLITADATAIRHFAAEHKDIILKPLYAFGGESVFRLRADDANLEPTIELLTTHYRLPLIAQRYIPEVEQGDIRILLLDGEILGAFRRIPKPQHHRANLATGGSLAAHTLRPVDHRICEALKPWLKQHGFFFTGIDIIGDYLTEINITSPLGIKQIEKLTGINHAPTFWDKLEQTL